MIKAKLIVSIFILQLFCGPVAFAQNERGATNFILRKDIGQTERVKPYNGSYAPAIRESDYTKGWDVLVRVKDDRGLTKVSKAQMEILLSEMPPEKLRELVDDPDLLKQQIEQVAEFLAIAQEAWSTGFADQPEIKEELSEIEINVVATAYDKEKNKSQKNRLPFASITAKEVQTYLMTADNSAKFDQLIEAQIALAQKDGRLAKGVRIEPEQIERAREQYAKVRIYADEAKAKWSQLSGDFRMRTEFRFKLQQAQYLAQKFSVEKIEPEARVSADEVSQYLVENPELAKVIAAQKALAADILRRVKAGEDFGKLARQFSDDPKSKNDGGLYREVPKGVMLPEIETAALALIPGQIADGVIETELGYNVIKLVRKGLTAGPDGQKQMTYDFLIVMLIPKSDQDDPQIVSSKQQIRIDLGKEKERKLIAEIRARHQIEIADDIEIKIPKPR